ncbi:DNA-methyltransferase [Hymenobacter sp. BT491]|uniref:DNA-methyltransferase n=1 Tax=Hymenobacter sp. BT491 TaxID=2766779 RepID=UPI0016538287|nr:site-specific DNA-methyltransferase [Hymenobacter sp. BT491]MBC6988916.1 site-specific DNA-methyltransferase [Hymenobacter sp. BT491]
MFQLLAGDCLALLKTLPDNSVDLIATDPPYFRVKGEAWDNQWSNSTKFLEWIDALCVEWKRVLKPNGSLYVFASPQMSHGVEGVIRKHFNVLTNIRWQKPKFSTKAEMFRKEDLRAFFPASESIIFAEQVGSDTVAMGEAGYTSKCEAAKVVVFGDYLRAEMKRAGVTSRRVAALFPSRTGGLTGCVSNWLLGMNVPMPEQYATIRDFLNQHGGEYLRRDYEELRRDYEELRRDYEELRRPFIATAETPYTDVWTFATVGYYKGKHVCEKPAALMEHIIRSSSRPGAVVLDCFMGSNATGKAARTLGRSFIGMELDPHWVAKAREEHAAYLPRPAACPPAAWGPTLHHTAQQAEPFRVYEQLTLFASA